jgi:hypothetical protein
MRHTSKDGLLSSNDLDAVALWDQLQVERIDRQSSWNDALRKMGVKLAHPDDGWVKNRGTEFEYLHLSWYPEFNDDPEVGDLMALGCPSTSGLFKYSDANENCAWEGYRIVRVTLVDIKTAPLGGLVEKYHFEDTGIRYPSLEPKKEAKKRFRLMKRRSDR